jgi:hypothetical protein
MKALAEFVAGLPAKKKHLPEKSAKCACFGGKDRFKAMT